jgi:hypothetical protein
MNSRLAGKDMRKAQLLELVLGTLGRLSGVAPVLFTVEDLHWADCGSRWRRPRPG